MAGIVDDKVQALWENVVQACNKILYHAKVYGFQLMTIPDPNIHDIARTFDTVVIPLLDDLADYNFSPESGMKMANIKMYALHLRAITIAIDKNDKDEFDKNVGLLMSESMLT